MIRVKGVYPYLFILPIGVGIGLFSFYCAIEVVRMSFFESSILVENYVGLANYFHIFKEKWFLIALMHTLYYAAIYVPLNLIIGLLIANILFKKMKGGLFFRILYMLPWVSSPVVVALVFRYIFNPEWGVVNWILVHLGFSKVMWTQSALTAIPVVSLIESWRSMGFGMIIFLGAMSGINNELFEAAELDGAGWFQKFFHITIPLLKPAIFFYAIISLLYAFQVFDSVYAFVEGVRGVSSWHIFTSPVMVSAYFVYSTAFRAFEFGRACAMAVSLFAITILIIGLQRYLLRAK